MSEDSKYTTKVTYLKGLNKYGCRIFYDGKLILEGQASCKQAIGPVFRTLLRTLDTLGGDQYTHTSRKRNNLPKNSMSMRVLHIWYREKP